MTRSAERQEGGQPVLPNKGQAAVVLTGWVVFAVLVALILLEYVVFLVVDVNLPLMVVMNVIDAALIMYYFMHVSRLWRRENNEGEKEEGA